jgi:two-component system CheB/CheR fusion protein
LSSLRIILAEDNVVNQKVALFMLKKFGCHVDIANNGIQVLALLEKQTYDVILMDVQMPEMDGLTATKMIRQSSQYQPYIIALTANALDEDQKKCLDVGMNDYLRKPIILAKLTDALEKFLNSQV